MTRARDGGEERRKPRLLVLASTYPRWEDDHEPGFVHHLARYLVDDFDVTVLCPHAFGALPCSRMDGVDVVRYRYAPARLEVLVNNGGIVTNLARRPWTWLLVVPFVLMQVLTLWRLLRRLRPDAVHAHWIVPQGLLVAVLRIVEPCTPAFVITSHGADLYSLRGASLQRLKRWVVGKARAVTVVSDSMREELHRIGADTSHVTVQPMGVDLSSQFTPDDAVPRAAEEILFVGRLVEKKGLRDLLDAMPHVLARRPGARLTVAGFGPEDDERRAQAARLGLGERVNFLGAVSQAELPSLYRRASVFVAPFVQARSGDREGLGLVMVEALGCACPVVTTRIEAVREVFGGWPAYLADAGSPRLLAEQILRVLDDADAARAWAGDMRTRVRERFDHRLVAAGYAQVLHTVTDDRAGATGLPGA